MKPKSIERGVAIGAALLALNGCADSCRNDRSAVRFKLNACLNKTHPKHDDSIQQALDKNFYHIFYDDKKSDDPTRSGFRCEGAVLDVDLNSCGNLLTVYDRSSKSNFVCNDKNADRKWESVGPVAPPECSSLNPTDETGNPKKWKGCQDVCNDAFSRCLGQSAR